MNTTMDSRFVDLTILIQDQNGQISEQFGSEGREMPPDLEEGKKKRGKTLYQKIARSDFEVRKNNTCVWFILVVRILMQLNLQLLNPMI